MPSQPILRPFDIAVALQLLLVPESRYEPLAEALVTSTSAVHRSVARLQASRLCNPRSRTVSRPALREFLLHGVRYAFPPVHGPERLGMPTGTAQPDVKRLLAGAAESRPMVWSTESGTLRAESLVPLFGGLPAVAARDPRMHELLACVDLLRTGTDRERQAIGDALTQELQLGDADAPAARKDAA